MKRCWNCHAAWMCALPLVAALGCNRGEAPRPKPTTDEITALRKLTKRDDEQRRPLESIKLLLKEPDAQDAATEALARIGPAAIDALIGALQDPDPHVRAHAASAVARMGPVGERAVPALIAALGDANDDVRRAAARALGQIGPAAKEAIPHLVAVLKEHSEELPQSPREEPEDEGR